MIFIVLYIQVLVQVLSEAPPASPQDVHVDKGLLTWTPATDETNITYTVESFDTVWSNVPSCLHISFTSCCVKDFGCVMLRVQAERHGLTSRPAEACSRHGDICTPEVNLTARPGSLTVHLRKNHSMTHEHGDHAKHRVYYGKEGEPLEQMYVDAASSVSIDELQGGQRYCTKVQYINMGESVGLPRCTQCKDIPKSENPKRTEMIVAVVVVVVLVTLIPVIAYILIFQRGTIKEWLRPQYNISVHLFDPFLQHHHPISTSCPGEERIDVISCFTPENQE